MASVNQGSGFLAPPKRSLRRTGTSIIEVQIRCELGLFFSVPHDKANRTIFIKGKRYEVDFLLSEEKIAVEYDSALFHKDREQHDARKLNELEENGWNVIRIREAPLTRLGENDVVVPNKAKVKEISNIVLSQIEEMKDIRIPQFEEYQQESFARSSHEADQKIDELLEFIGPVQRALRARELDSIFGGSFWRKHNETLLSKPLIELQERASELTEILGPSSKWKRQQPSLLGHTTEAIRVRAELLTELTDGTRWRRCATLLALSDATLKNRALYLTDTFEGTKWVKTPDLLVIGNNKILQRVKQLDRIFNGRSWTQSTTLLALSSDTITKRSENMNQAFGGESWKKFPSLLTRTPESFMKNSEQLNELFGNKAWMKHPSLVGSSPITIKNNVTNLNQTLGNNSWQKYPQLVALQPKRISRKAKTLSEILGNDKWKKSPSLLAFSEETLWAKSTYITKLTAGNRWTLWPTLLGYKIITLEAHAQELTQLFKSDIWKKEPNLLLRDPSVLKEKSLQLDSIIGTAWMRSPVLIGYALATVERRAALLHAQLGEEVAQQVLIDSPWLIQRSDTVLKEWVKKRLAQD